MRALAITDFGGPEVLKEISLDPPEPGHGEVAIDVAWAGVNYAEVLYRRGVVDVPLPFVPGIELSGHVRAVGPGVSGLERGEPVAALAVVKSGAYAEQVVVDARLVVPLRGSNSDLRTSAAIPSNSTSAMLILERVARLTAGERVLVHAAAGGVGSQLGQVARSLEAGCVVGTVGSEEKLAVARGFGYDDVILRTSLGADARKFDVVVDPVGGSMRRASYEALALDGRLIAMGNASGAADVTFGASELWLDGRTIAGFNLAAFAAASPEQTGRAFARAVRAVEEGWLHVEASAELALEDAAQAHEWIESGRSTGKLVLRVGGA
jgi:NADPH:quinone reductase